LSPVRLGPPTRHSSRMFGWLKIVRKGHAGLLTIGYLPQMGYGVSYMFCDG
jgi:hypothetical protein